VVCYAMRAELPNTAEVNPRALLRVESQGSAARRYRGNGGFGRGWQGRAACFLRHKARHAPAYREPTQQPDMGSAGSRAGSATDTGLAVYLPGRAPCAVVCVGCSAVPPLGSASVGGVDPDALVRAKVVAVATMADEPEAGGVCYLCARAG